MGNSRRKLYPLIIAGASFILVIGAMLTALAETGFSPAQSEATADTVIPIATSTIDKQTAIPVIESPTATIGDSKDQPTATLQNNTPTSTLTEIPTILTTATQTLTTAATQIITCSKPIGWINYTVKSGDTLYSIAVRYQTNVATLQIGNCFGSSTKIITGSTLWVPNNPTITPSPTNTPSKTKIVCYTLTLSVVGDGSELTASPQKSDGCTAGKYVAGEKVTLTAAPAAGWSVGSWTGTDNDSSTAKTNTVTMPAIAHAVTVTFTLDDHTVTFNANGGTGTMTPQVANVPTALTLNTFTRTGYTFAGWDTIGVGGGTAYADGAIYDFAADVTLYAQWTMQASDHEVIVHYSP